MSANPIESFAPRKPNSIGGRTLKRAFMAGIGRVLAERDTLNTINVFPVADGDTGSNLGFTLAAVGEALESARGGQVGTIMQTVASEAIDGARGNSGAILAQFLQGLGETLAGHDCLTPGVLERAVSAGSDQARQAVATPREGTMLSVIAAFARALRSARDDGAEDIGAAFVRALAAARSALADTPNQLAVLRKAGVVDAGAQGFVNLLEGIHDYMLRGRIALRGSMRTVNTHVGVVADVDSESPQRWCSECVLSAAHIDRDAVRAALERLDGSSLVMAGTREKLRIHMHVDEPSVLFDTLARFGEVRAPKADDMHAQRRTAHAGSRVVVVIDSAADLPASALEQLPVHVVPVRISAGAEDYLDKVSLSPQAFYTLLRSSAHPVRTSQPPPGDFRRLFGFLLSHNDAVVYVGLSRALSGTLQAAETAAAGFEGRVHVVDSANVSGGQGLLAVHAAERAAAGDSVADILASLEPLRQATRTFCYVRDLAPAVRGGRIPVWALPITRWLRLVPLVRIGGGDGRLHISGVMRDSGDLPRRFVVRALRGLDRSLRWRAQILHCDNLEEGGQVRAALQEQMPDVQGCELLDAGSAIGAHAGAGAVALAMMPARAAP